MSALTNSQNRKLAAQLTQWQEDLINLTKRNRLIYFSHTKVGSLEITEPGMVEVFSTLHRSGWDLTAPGDESNEDHDDPEEVSLFDEEPSPVPRRPDELMVGNKTYVRLQRDLKLLDGASRQVSLDTGLWVLYLGFGMLRWIDENDEQRESPLLLCPVQLTREGKAQRFRLSPAEEDLAINPALALKLENDFGITLPTSDAIELSPRAVCDAVADRVRKKKWYVEDRVVMARFTFHKEAMYRDLLNHADQIGSHPIVQMMGLGPEAPSAQQEFRYYEDEELDVVVQPEDLVSIRDADSTQRRCILAAREGVSFVMDGPPGTGKSQTIVNIIVELLHMGKSVLFVSEKAAALEVVYKRLAEANLTDFVLEIHSHKATRKEVAGELGRALNERPTATPHFTPTDRRNLIRLRKQLTDYAIAMNEVRRPLGVSLHNAIGRVALLQELPHAPVPASIGADLTPEDIAVVMDAGERLSRAWDPVLQGDDFLWRDLAEVQVSAAYQQRVTTLVDNAIQALDRLARESHNLAEHVECDQPLDLASTIRLRDLVDAATSYSLRSQVPTGWLIVPDLTTITATLKDRRSTVAETLDSRNTLESIAGPGWIHAQGLDFAEVGEAIASLTDLGNPQLLDKRATELAGARDTLHATISKLDSISKDAELIASSFQVPSSELSFAECEDLAELACQIGSTTPPENSWLSPLSQVALTEAESVLVPLVEAFRGQRERLKEVFTDEVLELDLEQLRTRLQSKSGVGKLSGSYRADKKKLAATVVNGKVTKAVIEQLDDAVAWKAVHDRLLRQEAVHASQLGRYYSGPLDTDLDRLDRAIDLARRAIALAEHVPPQVLASQIGAEANPDPATLLAGRRLAKALEDWRDFSVESDFLLTGGTVDSLPDEVKQWSTQLDMSVEAISTTLGALENATGQAITVREVETFITALETYQTSLARLEETKGDDQLLLGPFFRVLESDFDVLDSHLTWVKELRSLNGGPLDGTVATQLTSGDVSATGVKQSLSAYDKATDAVLNLFVSPWRQRLLDDLSQSFDYGTLLLNELRDTVGAIDVWSRFVAARTDLNDAGLTETVDFLSEQKVPAEKISGVIMRAVYEAWIDSVIGDDTRIGSLSANDRDDLRQRFLRLDEQLVHNASAGVINACSDRRPQTNLGGAATILREANKKSRHKPIRQLLAETWEVAVALKPCFMMSPLTVSRFLPSDVRFDVVIFDEASQVTPADAISSVYRGNQLIVAGDQMQLPPTNFFDSQTGSDGDGDGSSETPDDFESVLDICKGTTMPGLPLQWHYRSQHEHLITYSNYRFYDGRLHTFPGAAEQRPDLGIELFKVDGVYRRGANRDNPIEAGAVVDRVLHHRRHHPELTIGVVAFSVAQQDAILAEIERRMADEPELRVLRFDDRLDGFFVKNLENVQGDDRDIIIFSIGYGPDENGKFTENLGPLSRTGGHRRLNVAITRARRRVEVVSSVRAGDFPGSSEMPGVRHLQRYLDFAERGVPALSLDLTDSLGDAESPFEEAVIAAVSQLGFDPVPQVGVAGYRIDIGVRHPQRPGEFVLGIECDGAQYHSSKVARDRDRLRQSVLEGLGWRIHRIWGPAWYRDRNSQIEHLTEAIRAALRDSGSRPKRTESPRLPTVEIHEADLDARPQWVEDYQRSKWRPKAHDVEEASLAEISAGVVRIVADEGPIHHDQVLHRLKEAYGRKRLTAQLRELLEPGVVAAKRRKEIETIDTQFLCLPGQVVVVRVPPEGDENPRAITEVSPSERRLALKGLVDDCLVVDQDEVIRAVARLFGWRRTGEEIMTTLQKDLKKLATSGQIAL